MYKTLHAILLILFSISLHGGSWSAPAVLSSSGVNSTTPQVGMDASGNAFAAWIENGFVKSSKQPVNGSWGASSTLSNTGASSPCLVVDPSGNATAIWIESGLIKTATMPSGGSWGSAIALSSTTATSPQLVVDSTGNVVAIWARGGAIESSTLPFGGSWPGSPSVLVASGGDSPQVAIGGGNIVAVWHDAISEPMDAIFSATNTVGGTWTSPILISDDTVDSAYPCVAVDSNGNALAIWFRFDVAGTVYSDVVVQTSAFPVGGSWNSSPMDMSNPGILNPANLSAHVAFDGSGNAIAIWTQSFDGIQYQVETSIQLVGGTWTSAADVFINIYSIAYSVSVDTDGSATLLTMFFDPNSSMLTIQATGAQVPSNMVNFWSIPIAISTGSQNGFPQVASTSNGVLSYNVGAWVNFNGTNTIINASTQSGQVLQPPTSPSVIQSSNNFGVFTEYYNTVSWVASSSPSFDGYIIFRNGTLIGQVNSSVLSIIDNNRNPSESDTYTIAAYDSEGDQSVFATISFP